MAYLTPFDYVRLIQEVSMQQIISGNQRFLPPAEVAAISEMKSYLRAKYDIDNEFTDTTIYNPTAQYKAANRVYLDAAFYNDKTTYPLNTLTLRQGKVYLCSVAITAAEDFTPGHWTVLGDQYDYFYAQYPKPVFDLKGTYAKDDQVFWKDKVYVCKIPTTEITHDVAIQFISTTALPYTNVFPDNASGGEKFWGLGTAYNVAAGKILDTVFFTKGDNRNQQLVMFAVDIAIYNLYRRIPPGVVPEMRILAQTAAIRWLKLVATGDEIVADIVKKQPPQGNQIRYGSKPKQINDY